jgi:uncharacterized membrane protein
MLIDQGVTGLAGWKLSIATAISADGQTVVGYGINPSGLTEAWIATVPEPSTLVLSAGAAMGLGLVTLSRRRSAGTRTNDASVDRRTS